MEGHIGWAVWLFIFVGYLIYVLLVFALPTALVPAGAGLSRKSFVIRFLSALGGTIVAIMAILIVVEVTGGDIDGRGPEGVSKLLGLVFTVLLSYWSAKRAQDIGWTKWWNLLYGVPIMNLVYLGTMLFVRSAEAPAQDAPLSGEAVSPEV